MNSSGTYLVAAACVPAKLLGESACEPPVPDLTYTFTSFLTNYIVIYRIDIPKNA